MTGAARTAELVRWVEAASPVEVGTVRMVTTPATARVVRTT